MEIRDVNCLRQKLPASSSGVNLYPSRASPSFTVTSKEFLCDGRKSGSVSSNSSFDCLTSNHTGDLPSYELFPAPDVDDTFLIATGNDVNPQRSERAAKNGNACGGLDLGVACELRCLSHDTPSCAAIEARDIFPDIRDNFLGDLPMKNAKRK